MGFDAADCLAALDEGNITPASRNTPDTAEVGVTAAIPAAPDHNHQEVEPTHVPSRPSNPMSGPISQQDLQEAGPSGMQQYPRIPQRGRPKKRIETASQFSFMGPKCVRNQEAYRAYYEQEADQFVRACAEQGTIPLIPPTGKDITRPEGWKGLPVSDAEKLAYAWGAAQAANPYGIAVIINQGGSLATAISHALQTIEPTRGVETWYSKPPVWPIAGTERVLMGQTSKTLPTTKDLRKDMDTAERVTFLGLSGFQVNEVHLAQSAKIRIRTYVKKNKEGTLTHAGAADASARGE